MTTTLILLASGILIGAGFSIIVRDLRRNRRRGFVSARDARAGIEPEVEITISHSEDRTEPVAQPRGIAARSEPSVFVPPPPPIPALAPAPVAAALAPRDAPPEVAIEASPRHERTQPPRGDRPPFEQQWSLLEAAVGEGVDRVNARLAPARLSIGASGDPAWSYKNRGYGAYRRLLLERDSVAWLRLELSGDGRLHASVKAHKDDRTELNGTADAPVAGLDAARAADLLLQCLQPAANSVTRKPTSQDDDEVASEQAWGSVDALVTSALKATNGALAQAGARLVPLGPVAWEAALRRHRMTLCVEVNGDDVARMHIERLPHEMEVAVGVRDARMVDLGRRRRLPVEGMTIHALAELIASCAWPAIARLREDRRQA